MNTSVLPYGNHYGAAQDVLSRLPAGVSAVDPYGIPAVGTPESEQLRQLMTPTTTVEMSPEELEALKWQNWAQAQRFEALGPGAQAQMARNYYNNVLPYVASSMQASPEALQQEFVVNYPEIGAFVTGEPSEMMLRAADAERFGLEGRQYQQYATGSDPDFPESPAEIQGRTAAETAGPILGRQQALSELDEAGVIMPEGGRESFILFGENSNNPGVALQQEFDARSAQLDQLDQMGLGSGITDTARALYLATGDMASLSPKEDPMLKANAELQSRSQTLATTEELTGVQYTPEQRSAYIATGDQSVLRPGQTEKANEASSKAKSADETLIRQLNSNITTIQAAVDQANKLTDTLNADGVLPVSGPAGRLVAEYVPWVTNASTARSYLKTLKANAVFTKLQELRDASANGSSGLGQVTNVEIDLLGSALASLEIDGLSDEDLQEQVMIYATNIAQVQEDIRRRLEAEQSRFNSIYGTPDQADEATAPATAPVEEAAPAPTQPATNAPVRLRFDREGNLIE